MSDYPPALWVPADKSNYRSWGLLNRTYEVVVVHCTDGHERAQPVAEMWQQPKHGSSAHFVIGHDGLVIQCVRLGDVAWHAHAANAYSVGIEHCARTPGELGPNDAGLAPSEAQYAASAKLVAWLCRRANLAPNRDVIVGHAEADPATTHRACPLGCGWSWSHYMDMVQMEYDAYDEAS